MAEANPTQQQPHPLTTTAASTGRAPITAAATAFLESYARAMHLADPSNTGTSKNLGVVAAALAAHYGTGCTAYSLTHHVSLPSAEAWLPGIAEHLARFERAGLGCDIRLARHRVEPVSEGSALCWLTWRIRPPPSREGGAGREGWEWENVYAYRRAPPGGGPEEGATRIGAAEGAGAEGWEKPEGWWEFIVSDNELSSLLARVPDFMTL
ncbi:hypothetical protein SLS55_005217 [Diplodia seriata]|uniref:SnoaL-like domain-containing protein n=1 Tax=Diplodia seriata TaxID=420778 RepID=A0ABR3CFR5_9PEZI